jgi:hypothetical protein
MPSLSKSFSFSVYSGNGSAANSVAVPYPLFPMNETGTRYFTSFKEKCAGYYGTTNGLHSLTVTTTPSFLGTVKMQATLAVDPTETDWFDIKDVEFTYTENSPGYEPSLLAMSSPTSPRPRTDYANFKGQFTWLRAKIDIDSGAVMSIMYNY